MTNSNNDRPVFLTVLCIISFVGLGFSVLSNLISLSFLPFYKNLGSFQQLMMEKAIYDMQNEIPHFAPVLKSLFQSITVLMNNMGTLILVNLLCSIVALYGVLMMWQLKKIGFSLYSTAKVLAVLVPVFIIGWNLLSALILTSGLFFAGALILLYGLNLKSMDRSA